MHTLEEFYNEYLSQVPRNDAPKIHRKDRIFYFKKNNAPQYIDSLTSSVIRVIKRQLLRPAALEDNIIISLPKSSARAIGIVILAVLFDNKKATSIELTNHQSEVKRIQISPPNQHDYYHIAPEEMIYKTANLHVENSKLSLSIFESNPIQFLLHLPENEYAPFENKNELQINSSPIGLMMLAERFLNLGLDSSITNYINIGRVLERCDIPVCLDSCSGRIEISSQDGQ